MERLFDSSVGEFLFTKYWYLPSLPYNKTALPGNIAGVSGSTIGGPNLGISTYIDDSKLNSALIAFEFITSREIQKSLIINNHLFSGIPSLYDDPEVCASVDCEFFKSIQLIPRPTDKAKEYSKYSEKFRNYLFEYIYGNKSPEEVLKNIDDITRFYSLTIKNDNTPVGTIIFSAFMTFSLIMLFSLKFLTMEKYKPYFVFLPNDLWVFIVLGSILIMSSCLTMLGELSTLKCQFLMLLLSLGFTFSIIPIFYKLIVNFPEVNGISLHVYRNKYPFVLLFLLIDILLNSLSFNSPFQLDEKLVDDGQNFKVCKITNFGKILLSSLFSIKIIIMLCILFFIFIEWNLENTRRDIRFLSAAIYMDIVSIGVLLLISYMDINNYVVFYALPTSIYIFFAITNYTLFYAYRILRAYGNDDGEIIYFSNLEKNTSSNDNIYYYNSDGRLDSAPNNHDDNNYKDYKGKSNEITMPNKIYDYHYRKTTSDNSSTSSNSIPYYNSNHRKNYY